MVPLRSRPVTGRPPPSRAQGQQSATRQQRPVRGPGGWIKMVSLFEAYFIPNLTRRGPHDASPSPRGRPRDGRQSHGEKQRTLRGRRTTKSGHFSEAKKQSSDLIGSASHGFFVRRGSQARGQLWRAEGLRIAQREAVPFTPAPRARDPRRERRSTRRQETCSNSSKPRRRSSTDG